MAFAVVKSGSAGGSALSAAIIADVRGQLGPVAALKDVHVVRALPKTRSGKILRAVLRRLANGEAVETPPTIEDAAVLEEYRAIFARAPG